MTCRKALEIDWTAYVVDPGDDQWEAFRLHYPSCNECALEVARWSNLTASIEAASPEFASAHPATERLLAYHASAQGLGDEERAVLESHLGSCKLCQVELRALRQFNAELFTAPAQRDGDDVGLVGRLFAGLQQIFASPQLRPAYGIALLLLIALPLGRLLLREGQPNALNPGARQVAEAELPQPTPVGPTPEPSEVSAAPSAEPTITKEATVEEPSIRVPARESPTPDSVAPEELPKAKTQPILVASLDLSSLPRAAPRYESPYFGKPGPLGRLRSQVRDVPGASLELLVLAPKQIGWTTMSQPSLYWLLPKGSAVAIEISLIDADSEDPIFRRELTPPVAAGFQSIDLSELGISLEADTDYEWSITAADAREGTGTWASAMIRRNEPGIALTQLLEESPREHAAEIFARHGYWYDAFSELSNFVQQHPRARAPRLQRASLLEQVGVAEAAAFERANAEALMED